MPADRKLGAEADLHISENGNPSTISLDAGIRRNIVTSVNKATAEYDGGPPRTAVTLCRPAHTQERGQAIRYGRARSFPFPAIQEVRQAGDETGGTAGGLCGINCKHSFFPYYEGMQKTDWHIDLTPRQNEELYDDIQKQRSYEARIRSWKRRQVLAGTQETLLNTPRLPHVSRPQGKS